MKTRMIIAMLMAAALGLGGTALAQGPGEHPGLDMMKQADTNADGSVTFDELVVVAPNMTKERFAQLDRNGDGVLSPADRPEGGQGQPGNMMRERFQKADADKDGKVTFEELKAVAPEMTREKFDAMDKNKDGALTPEDRPAHAAGPGGGHLMQMLKDMDADGNQKLTLEEIKAKRPGFPDEMFKSMDTNKDGVLSKDDHPMMAGPGSPREMLKELFAKADADKDGKLTYDEIKAVRPKFPEEIFKRMDTNKDGVLSKEDRPAGPPETAQAPAAEQPAQAAAPKPRLNLKEADTNGDGRVTLEEAQKAMPAMTPEKFKRMDRNADGAITKEDRKKSENKQGGKGKKSAPAAAAPAVS